MGKICWRVRRYIYRPQTKFAKVMFLLMSVCPQGVGVVSQHVGVWPGGSPGPHLGEGVPRPTPEGVSRPTPRGSPGPHLGGSEGPHPGGSPCPHPGGYPSMHWGRHPLTDSYCCGQYASYWNAFLWLVAFGYHWQLLLESVIIWMSSLREL